ncbi:MAG: DUF4233 domain-containing protein [Nocardiopsaceae bacterium]|nr:DUF4233 domain-containing protein [Nocardiopsaceae bacterium]
MCGTVLGLEAVVVLLAIVPAIRLEHLSGGTAATVGGAVAVVAIVLSGLVGRPGMGWVLYAGTVFQLLVIASGAWVPMMYVLGVIFALLWFTGIWLARKVEREQRSRAGSSAGSGAGPSAGSGAGSRAEGRPTVEGRPGTPRA